MRIHGLCPLLAMSALAEATGRALGTGEHLCRGQAARRSSILRPLVPPHGPVAAVRVARR